MEQTTTKVGTYQMLWDCPSCGTKKLLGVDHRSCPHCGTSQNANLRYFPHKRDRVRIGDEGFAPDWECSHCGTACAYDVKSCRTCGASRGNSPAVFVRKSIDSRSGETGAQAKAEWRARRLERTRPLSAEELSAIGRVGAVAELKQIFTALTNTRSKIVGLVAAFLSVVALIWFVNSEKQVEVGAVQHSWERKIPVERYMTVDESDWCNSVPSSARIHSRRQRIHHYDKVADGEDCRDVPGSCTESCINVDNGNGSFSEVCTESCSASSRECETRYREEPVYELECGYEIERWKVQRSFDAKGDNRIPVPYWPTVSGLSNCSGTQVGCERIGKRFERYRVHFLGGKDTDKSMYSCQFPQSRWEAIEVGEVWTAKVARLSGKINCKTLVPLNAN